MRKVSNDKKLEIYDYMKKIGKDYILYNFKGYLDVIKMLILINMVPLIVGSISVSCFILELSLFDNELLILLVSIVIAVISTITIALNVFKYFSAQNGVIVYHYSIKEMDDIYSDEIIANNSYQCVKNGKSRLIYRDENNEFVINSGLKFHYRFKWTNPYCIPEDIVQNAFRYLNDKLKLRKHFFNENKIRMEMGIEEFPRDNNEFIIQLSKTNYYNSICTNEISSLELRSRSRADFCFEGYSLVKSGVGHIYSLSESLCSNHIGVSTLAITEDKYAILTVQGNQNLIDSNRFIVSASGSLDYSDRKKSELFRDIIIKGMERELREECNLNNAKFQTQIVGYGRLLDRGGKPEFFGITEVDMNHNDFIEQAEKSKEKSEGYVKEYIAINLNDGEFADNVYTKIKGYLKDNENLEDVITVQLNYYIKVLWSLYKNKKK